METIAFSVVGDHRVQTYSNTTIASATIVVSQAQNIATWISDQAIDGK